MSSKGFLGLVIVSMALASTSWMIAKSRSGAKATAALIATSPVPTAKLVWSDNPNGIPIATLLQDESNEIQVNATNMPRFLPSVKEEILAVYNTTGAVILRGFPLVDSTQAERAFNLLTDHRPGGGPLGWLPGWTQNMLKDTVMWTMVRLVDGKRKGGMRALAPASKTVQGPHQEASFLTWRMPHVGFYCEVPPPKDGETALHDAVAAHKALPIELQTKLKQYDFYYDMYVGIFYETLPKFLHDLIAEIALFLFNQPRGWVPLLLRSPVSGETCLQWFGFGNRLNQHAANAFNKIYPGRDAEACYDYYGDYYLKPTDVVRGEEDLLPIAKDGQHFLETDEIAITEALFAHSTLISWEKNDLVLVDNIRWAHGRVPGDEGSPRMLHFFQAQPVVPVAPLAVR